MKIKKKVLQNQKLHCGFFGQWIHKDETQTILFYTQIYTSPTNLLKIHQIEFAKDSNLFPPNPAQHL